MPQQDPKARAAKKQATRAGLSLAEAQQMLVQGCQVCGSTEALTFDHDHTCCIGKRTCGKCLRGVLCRPCNLALGYAEDDPERLRNLANYLDGKHRIPYESLSDSGSS